MKYRIRFRDGRQLQCLKATKVPASTRKHKIEIETDIIDGNIPLLLLKSATKKALLQLNVNSDSITFLGDKILQKIQQIIFFDLKNQNSF